MHERHWEKKKRVQNFYGGISCKMKIRRDWY